MSYDVFIMKFVGDYAAMADVPDDEKTVPLGSVSDVRAAVDREFTTTKWNADGWGVWEDDFGSIEFHISDEVHGLTLHIRASDDVMPGVVALCRDNSWHGLDGGDAFVESREYPASGLVKWQAYRDAVLKKF